EGRVGLGDRDACSDQICFVLDEIRRIDFYEKRALLDNITRFREQTNHAPAVRRKDRGHDVFVESYFAGGDLLVATGVRARWLEFDAVNLRWTDCHRVRFARSGGFSRRRLRG